MSTNYTPGPWKAAELQVDGAIITRPGTFEIRTPGYDVAAHIPGGAPFRKEADAVLAAAAPELLDACETALDVYRFQRKAFDIDDDRYVAWTRLIDRQGAVIAKATGE